MTSKPKIAFVTTLHNYAWGGCEDLWYESALRLLSDGYPVAANICEWHEPIPKFEHLAQSGCELEERPQDAPPVLRLRERLQRRLRPYHPIAWLQKEKPDLVVISLSGHHQGIEWMDACRTAGLPYIIVVHAVGDGIWPDPATASAMRRGYEGARQCLFVSNGNLEQVRNQIAAPLEHASVIRNPFNVPYDAQPEWPDDSTTILACVGRLHPVSKGQDLLFSVLSQEKWRRRPIQVRLYGSGPDEESLKALKAMYKVTNVTFAGFQSNVVQIWRECHALVLPSRYEGLPLAIVEAMLCSRPCIVTDVAGNAELMEDGKSGFIAAAARTKYLDQAMEHAWSRRAEWQAIGKAAGESVRRLVPADPIAAFAAVITREAESVAA